jgi:hypothetical protein
MTGITRAERLARQAADAAPDSTDAPEGAVPKSRRRRRSSNGGMQLKLQAPERKGYVRRWVNDNPARVQNMEELGYDFAEADTKTDGQGTRISRIVGTKPDGSPLHAYLMETPTEEYAIGVQDKEERLKPFEQAIRAGRDPEGKLTDTYEPRDRSSLSHTR